ncbi:MAG TPA: helix-turn-helix domain-containing protein [Steroidobacteraceae bacterium]|nr:helix-turn-helix domain-containing protein [Steroidobacteraceae bacterium]
MATSEAVGGARERIGARLRSAREARGLTTLQAAEKLHVDPRILEALEAEDFAALGAAVYVRGHLRRYAELIGEAPAELQSLYTAATPAPDLTRIPHHTPPARSARLLALALLLLVGIAVVGLVWWLLTLPAAKPQPVSAELPAGAPNPPGSASAARLMTAVEAQSGGGGAAAAGEVQLALRFSELSWVAVYDGSGRRLEEGLNAPDSTRTVSGAPPLKVVIGNAPGVAVQLNGRKVALEGLVHRDGTARFLLDGSGHAAPVPPVVARQ